MIRIARHPLAVVVALALGIALAMATGHQFTVRLWHVLVLAGLAVVSAVPAVRLRVQKALEALRHPSANRRVIIAILVGAVALCYLLGTALGHNRVLIAKGHDESSYIIQARILAMFRLWMPFHPLADFLESFHLLTRPVYAPIYFPGTALMNVPMAWLDLPVHVVPLILAAMIVGLVYRIVTELVDGVSGLLAAMLMLSAYWFRTNATLVMAQSPAMLLGLLMFWAWLRWRSSPRWYWSAAIGAFAGWAAITRPVDALAFALPIGIAMFIQLLRGPGKRWLSTAILVVVAAAPFFALQLALNYGTTGNVLKSPYVLYLEHSQPATAYGYHDYSPDLAPKSSLLQKHAYYDRFLRDSIRIHRLDRIGEELIWRIQRTLDVVVPWGVMLVLLPIGVLGLCRAKAKDPDAPAGALPALDAPRVVLASSLPIFILLYLPNTFYLEHYCIPMLAPAALLLVLGVDTVRTMDAAERVRRPVGVFATLATAFLALAALPEFNDQVIDDFFHVPERVLVERMIEERIEEPAVLLVRFHMENNAHDEPVYNTDVAWPDDAPVVRLHDFGPARRREIVDYYAKHQPERNLYLYDRKSQVLRELGSVAALKRYLDTQAATTRTSQVPSSTPAPIIGSNPSQEQ